MTAAVASTWEQFTVINNTDGTVTFRAGINGLFVSADLNNGGRLIASIPRIGSAERERDHAERAGVDPGAGDLPRQATQQMLARALDGGTLRKLAQVIEAAR